MQEISDETGKLEGKGAGRSGKGGLNLSLFRDTFLQDVPVLIITLGIDRNFRLQNLPTTSFVFARAIQKLKEYMSGRITHVAILFPISTAPRRGAQGSPETFVFFHRVSLLPRDESYSRPCYRLFPFIRI